MTEFQIQENYIPGERGGEGYTSLVLKDNGKNYSMVKQKAKVFHGSIKCKKDSIGLEIRTCKKDDGWQIESINYYKILGSRLDLISSSPAHNDGSSPLFLGLHIVGSFSFDELQDGGRQYGLNFSDATGFVPTNAGISMDLKELNVSILMNEAADKSKSLMVCIEKSYEQLHRHQYKIDSADIPQSVELLLNTPDCIASYIGGFMKHHGLSETNKPMELSSREKDIFDAFVEKIEAS